MQETPHQTETQQGIEMPRPTSAPIMMAFGAMCMAAGLVLNWMFSAVGVILFFSALGRWVYILATGTGEERLPIGARPQPVRQSRVQVEPLRPGMPGHRMRIPDKVHPVSAGIKGGAIGGIAMATTALAYGIFSGRGLWYPVNLLGGMILPGIGEWTDEQLGQFDFLALVVGAIIFVLTSLGVGLMFGILLPTLPRVPILWGGVVAPLLWTGAIYGFMGILNPPLSEHVDWYWFFASQFAYGLVVGIVVIRSEKIPVGGFRS